MQTQISSVVYVDKKYFEYCKEHYAANICSFKANNVNTRKKCEIR